MLNWGPQRLAARIIDAHPRRFADPQDDSIFHPRTWHRAARLGQVSFHLLQRGLRGWSPRGLCRKVGAVDSNSESALASNISTVCLAVRSASERERFRVERILQPLNRFARFDPRSYLQHWFQGD